MNDLPQILRNNANWLKERGTFPKAAQACLEGADEIERLRSMLAHIANQDYDSGYSAEDFARHALDPRFDEGDVI